MGKIIKLKSSHTMSDSSVELAKKRAKKKYNDYLKKNPTVEYICSVAIKSTDVSI